MLELAFIKRVTRTDESHEVKNNLIKNFQTVIDKIESELSGSVRTEDERSKLQKLLARGYHELGVALQNQDQFFAANSYLEKAIGIRRLSENPEVAYSIFLQFMNATRAYRAKKIKAIDEFMPGWENSLSFELQQNAYLFREASEPENFSTTLHNLAYFHQFLATERENEGLFVEAHKEYQQAHQIYRNAKKIRERLRDPRRIAQSNVRIAECKLGLGRYALSRGALRTVCEFVDEASKLAEEVEKHYEEIPQEKFRMDDLESIRKNIEQLKRDAHCI
ncbi:Uncharacterised protein [uncultured archaeon]|nr:Uncharacterised protein [uncultured archaeon]